MWIATVVGGSCAMLAGSVLGVRDLRGMLVTILLSASMLAIAAFVSSRCRRASRVAFEALGLALILAVPPLLLLGAPERGRWVAAIVYLAMFPTIGFALGVIIRAGTSRWWDGHFPAPMMTYLDPVLPGSSWGR